MSLCADERGDSADAIELNAAADVRGALGVVQIRPRERTRVLPGCVWWYTQVGQVRALRVDLDCRREGGVSVGGPGARGGARRTGSAFDEELVFGHLRLFLERLGRLEPAGAGAGLATSTLRERGEASYLFMSYPRISPSGLPSFRLQMLGVTMSLNSGS